jgi:hypothetical protein
MTIKVIKTDGLATGTEPILEEALAYLERRGIPRGEIRRLEIVAEVGYVITLTPTIYVQAEPAVIEFPDGMSQADIDAFRAAWKANGGSPTDLKNGAGS